MKTHGKKIIALLGAGFMVAVILINIKQGSNGTMALSGGEVLPVEAQKVQIGNIESKVLANGVIEYADKSEVYVETPMQIKKLLIKEYQQVEAGQKLFELDKTDLETQLKQAVIDLKIQELNIQKMQAANPVQNVDEEETALARAQDALKYAKDKLLTNQQLYKSGAVSKEELKEAQKAYDDARLTLKNAQTILEKAKQKNVELGATSQIDLAIQNENAKSGRLKIQELKQRIQKLNGIEKSPIRGIVTDLNIEEGGMTLAGQPSLVISDIQSLKIKAQVNAVDINAVSPGQTVNITSEAIDKGVSITGKVESVSPVVQSNKTALGEEKVFDVTVTIDTVEQHLGQLSKGQSVDCAISTQYVEKTVVCTFDMINDDKDGKKFVYVVDPNKNVATKRYLTLGITSDLQAEVKSGLKSGEWVVVEPPLSLKDKGSVKITNKP